VAYPLCWERRVDASPWTLISAVNQTSSNLRSYSKHSSKGTLNKIYIFFTHCGRDTVVSIATRCGVDGPGFEQWCGKAIFCFPCPIRTALGLSKPPVHCVPAKFLRDKAARAWRDQSLPSKADINNECRSVPLFALFVCMAC